MFSNLPNTKITSIVDCFVIHFTTSIRVLDNLLTLVKRNNTIPHNVIEFVDFSNDVGQVSNNAGRLPRTSLSL